MSRLYFKMLALKPATGIKPEVGCDGLMYMIMMKRQQFAYHDRYIKWYWRGGGLKRNQTR